MPYIKKTIKSQTCKDAKCETSNCLERLPNRSPLLNCWAGVFQRILALVNLYAICQLLFFPHSGHLASIWCFSPHPLQNVVVLQAPVTKHCCVNGSHFAVSFLQLCLFLSLLLLATSMSTDYACLNALLIFLLQSNIFATVHTASHLPWLLFILHSLLSERSWENRVFSLLFWWWGNQEK